MVELRTKTYWLMQLMSMLLMLLSRSIIVAELRTKTYWLML